MAHSPAVDAPKRVKDSDFVPMGMSERQLALPEIEGFVTYWFADRPGRIGRAMSQGWQFISPDEVDVPNFKTISGSVADSGSTDLGDRISVHGYEGDGGKSIRLYAMKIEKDRWSQLEAYREQQSERIAAAVKGRRIGMEREIENDARQRYIPRSGGKLTLFDKKR